MCLTVKKLERLTKHRHLDLAPTGHNHDDRYYTESEIDAALAGIGSPVTILKHLNQHGQNQSIVETVASSNVYRACMPSFDVDVPVACRLFATGTLSFKLNTATTGARFRLKMNTSYGEVSAYLPWLQPANTKINFPISVGQSPNNAKLSAATWTLQLEVYLFNPSTMSFNYSGEGDGWNNIVVWGYDFD